METKYDIYHCSCGETYYSQKYEGIKVNDTEMKMSPQVAIMITRFGASSRSFEEAEKMLNEFNLAKISAPQIREITEFIGLEIDDAVEQKANEAYEKIIELSQEEVEMQKGTTMVIEFDGSMLRKILKKGTEWKEIKLGCIMIKNKLGKVIRKEYITCLGNAESFKKRLFELAVEMHYISMERIEVIADGAHWIWNICCELFPDAIEILDYYHCKENVYEYFNFIYQEDETKAKKEAKKIMKKIENEVKIETILKQIPIVENLPVGIVNLPKYLEYHQNRIKYKTYIHQNLDIGSGVIESGNKNVIQHRMKQTGMKWLESSIKAISILRCKIFSNRWDEVEKTILNFFPAWS